MKSARDHQQYPIVFRFAPGDVLRPRRRRVHFGVVYPTLRRRLFTRAAGRAAPGASPEGDPASPGTAVAREFSRASGLSEGARLMAAAAWPFEARFSDRRDRILVPKASHSEHAPAFRELGRSMESRDFAVALTFRKHS